MRVILASGSPRRKQLMKLVGIDCEVLVTDVDEPITKNAENLVRELSIKKNQAACKIIEAKTGSREDTIVISADTLVSFEGKVLEKPSSHEEAYEMLKLLSGNKHTVYTGVAISNVYTRETQNVFVESADVFFRELTDDEIYAYIKTGEPFDKAGAYGVQEKGALLVEKVHGDFYTVVGLPIMKVGLVLSQMGVDIWKV